MKEELDKQLAALAEKLGTSVEHLWGVLVRQAAIDGINKLVLCGAGLVFIATAVYLVLQMRTVLLVKQDPSRPFEERIKDGFSFFPIPLIYVLGALFIMFTLAMMATSFYWMLTDFFNPEYFALHQLPGF